VHFTLDAKDIDGRSGSVTVVDRAYLADTFRSPCLVDIARLIINPGDVGIGAVINELNAPARPESNALVRCDHVVCALQNPGDGFYPAAGTTRRANHTRGYTAPSHKQL